MSNSSSFVSILAGAILGLVVGSCDTTGGSALPTDVAAAAAGCPDMMSISAVGSTDFKSTFGIDAKAAAQIKAGVEAALELKGLSDKIDGELKVGCGGIANDLGKGGEFKSGTDACKAAASAIGEIKGKLGASAKLALHVTPPKCTASVDAMAECVGKCQADVQPGSVDVQCEPGKLSGQCDAECKGSCELKAAAKCEGTCQGSCDASFSGKCGGECKGKCDGKSSSGGHCAGKCEGSCTAHAEGKCGGKCEGSCKLSGAAKCEGTCHGDCSVQMKAPHCEGKMTPPKASAECKAKCDAKLQAEVHCTPAKVSLHIDGAADAALAAKFKGAIEKNLPVVLKIAIGMKDAAIHAAGDVEAVVKGVEAAVQAVGDAKVGAKLAACVASPFKAAYDAAASVKANVNVSVEVHASASASGSASGSAGGH